MGGFDGNPRATERRSMPSPRPLRPLRPRPRLSPVRSGRAPVRRLSLAPPCLVLLISHPAHGRARRDHRDIRRLRRQPPARTGQLVEGLDRLVVGGRLDERGGALPEQPRRRMRWLRRPVDARRVRPQHGLAGHRPSAQVAFDLEALPVEHLPLLVRDLGSWPAPRRSTRTRRPPPHRTAADGRAPRRVPSPAP